MKMNQLKGHGWVIYWKSRWKFAKPFQLQIARRTDDNDRSYPLSEEDMFFGAAKARYVWLRAKILHDRSTSESEMEGPGAEGCQWKLIAALADEVQFRVLTMVNYM